MRNHVGASLCLLLLFIGALYVSVGAEDLPTLTVLGTANDGVYFQHVFDEFEREGIAKIEFIPYPPGDRFDLIVSREVAGMPTDIYKTSGTMAGGLQAAGLVKDLSEFIERDPLLSIEDFLPNTVRPYMTGEKVFALPYALIVNSLRANITLIEEAGLPHPNDLSLDEWTWAEFAAYGRRLTRVAADGQLERLGIATLPDYLLSMVHQAGGYFFDHPGSPSKSGALLPETIRAVEEWVSWFYPNQIAQWGGRLNADRVAFDYTNVTPTFRDIPGDHTINYMTYGDFETHEEGLFAWDIIRTPMGPLHNANMDSSEALVISANTRYPDIAWSLLSRILTDPEVARKAIANNARPVGYIPNLPLWDDVWPPNAPAGVFIFREIVTHPEYSNVPSFARFDEHTSELHAGLRRAIVGQISVRAMLEELARFDQRLIDELSR